MMRRLGQVQRGFSLSVKNISVLLCGAPSAPLGLTARDRSLVSGRSIAGPLTDARPTRAADARKPTQRAGRFRGTARPAHVRHYCKRECARRSVMLAVCLCGRQRAEAHSRPRREQVMKRSGSREHRACSSRPSHGAEPVLQRSARPVRHSIRVPAAEQRDPASQGERIRHRASQKSRWSSCRSVRAASRTTRGALGTMRASAVEFGRRRRRTVDLYRRLVILSRPWRSKPSTQSARAR